MSPPQEIFFDEPRLKMTATGRFFVRVAARAGYALAVATAFVGLLSDLYSLRAAGILIALFLFDCMVHFGKPDYSLAHFYLKTRAGVELRARINAARFLTPAAYRAIESAFARSRSGNGSFALNLFRILAGRRDIGIGLRRMNVDQKKFLLKVDELLEAAPSEDKDSIPEISFIVVSSFWQARAVHNDGIEPKDLFAALMQAKDHGVIKLLSFFDIEEDDLEHALIWSRFGGFFSGFSFGASRLSRFIGHSFQRRHRVMNRAWTARPTPALDHVSADMSDAARASTIGFMVGHEKEYEALLDILAKPGNPNALLLGDPGAGKETVVKHLAFEITRDRVPKALFDKRLVSLSIGSLVAGAGAGEAQERIRKILEEIAEAGNVILYIPDIHNLAKAGATEVSAADILVPVIKGSGLQVVGATTPREFKQFIEPNSEFVAAFSRIHVQELSEREAVRYLIFQSLLFEREFKIIISLKAIKEAVRLAYRFLHDKLLPGSAEELLKEALADAVQKKKAALAAENVVALVEQKINVPLHTASGVEADKLLSLEKTIHERLVDQDEAVNVVSRAVREYRSGLSRRGGPVAAFLFVGPTGVGKTELAKILARIQFGAESQMLRFDMSEYQSKESFMRFIGSPDGTVRGALTDAVLEKPYSLLLFDECEKAHPDILNLFLQVFDDGRLTDNLGRIVDFSNTIIIATSNAHSEFVKEKIEKGASVAEITEQLTRRLGDYFHIELLNRFSAIVVFKPLSESDLQAVTKLALADLFSILRENQGIELQWDEAVEREVARLGYNPVFGARPLRRVIAEKLRALLAEAILKQEIARGTTVKISFDGNKFQFRNS